MQHIPTRGPLPSYLQILIIYSGVSAKHRTLVYLPHERMAKWLLEVSRTLKGDADCGEAINKRYLQLDTVRFSLSTHLTKLSHFQTFCGITHVGRAGEIQWSRKITYRINLVLFEMVSVGHWCASKVNYKLTKELCVKIRSALIVKWQL